MNPHSNGRNLFCDVTVVLKIAALLHQRVVRREGFGAFWILIQTLFYLENDGGVRPLLASIIRYIRYFWCHCLLDTFHSEFKSHRYKRSVPAKLQITRFYSKLSALKCSTETRECFKGVKYSYL